MNRYRSEPKASRSVFLTLTAAALVATAGGTMHAICKNQQVLTERKIDACEKRMEQAKLDIQIADVRMDQLVDRYELKEKLKTNGSTMIAAGHGDIIDVKSAPQAPAEVATTKQP